MGPYVASGPTPNVCSLSWIVIRRVYGGMAASGEKSEGEITSSDSGEEGREEERPPSPKRVKSAAASRREDGGRPEPGKTVEKGKKTKQQKREKRKLKKRVRECKRSLWNSSVPASVQKSVLAHQFLDSDQSSMLAQLASLLRPSSLLHPSSPLPPEAATSAPHPSLNDAGSSEDSDPAPSEISAAANALPSDLTRPAHQHCKDNHSTELQTFKTGKLQGVILHFLLGVPWLETPLEGLEELRVHRVAVVWLSMVSAKLFLSSSEVFSGVKALSPNVQFFLMHPGSTRYAKMGLESFLFLNREEEGGGRQPEGTPNRAHYVPSGGGAQRADYLLSAASMERNHYPTPNRGRFSEWSDYFMLCAEWPADDIDMQAANSYPMFAVDCEMVETKEGLELARVSLVDETLQCIYDRLVKPDNPVLDYKTQYSGITEDTLRDVSTTLADVHTDLLYLLPLQCILVGHSLENDFHALKMFHPYVIDTSCLFLATMNYQCKPKLRLLAKKLLGVDIQTGNDGHSPVQDASACMELVLKKLRDGEKMTIAWRSHSVLTEVASLGCSVAMVDRPSIVNLFGLHTNKYCVSSDEEVVTRAKEVVAENDLTFLQLHSYENYLKSSSAASEHTTERVLRQLDSEVVDIVASCPSGTLVVVVCGSSDVREVKQLQQRGERERLKEVVAVARTGLTHAFVVR